jgi:hypothetical protein
MTLPMTQIDGVPDNSSRKAGMAHFAGTGPAGKTCGDCGHMAGRYCAMYQKLTTKIGNTIRKTYPSCKYFEAKK